MFVFGGNSWAMSTPHYQIEDAGKRRTVQKFLWRPRKTNKGYYWLRFVWVTEELRRIRLKVLHTHEFSNPWNASDLSIYVQRYWMTHIVWKWGEVSLRCNPPESDSGSVNH